jgi:hypothetical protein
MATFIDTAIVLGLAALGAGGAMLLAVILIHAHARR